MVNYTAMEQFDPSLIGAEHPVGPLYTYSPYIAAIAAFMALQIIAVLGRVYVRWRIVKAFGMDDLACVITLIFSCAFMICIIVIWRLSGLKPLTQVPRPNIVPTVNTIIFSELLYIVSTMGLKISLGLLLLRILIQRWMRWVIYGTVFVSVAYGWAYFFIILFQCGNPIKFVQRIVLGQCLALEVTDGTSYAHAALTALADFIFAALPVIFLWNSNLNRATKISVGAILVLGSLGCICTFVRIGWIHYLAAGTINYLVTARSISLLSAIELSTGLVCMSLTTYRPLISRCLHRSGRYYDISNEDLVVSELKTASAMHLYQLSSVSSLGTPRTPMTPLRNLDGGVWGCRTLHVVGEEKMKTFAEMIEEGLEGRGIPRSCKGDDKV